MKIFYCTADCALTMLDFQNWIIVSSPWPAEGIPNSSSDPFLGACRSPLRHHVPTFSPTLKQQLKRVTGCCPLSIQKIANLRVHAYFACPTTQKTISEHKHGRSCPLQCSCLGLISWVVEAITMVKKPPSSVV